MTRPRLLRARDVTDLVTASAYPSISVLAPTEPGPRMTTADRQRLHALVADVDRQLRDHAVPSRRQLLAELAEQVRSVEERPTDRAVALYVSQAASRSFRLSISVPALGVVERTFATRALLTALHRMPPHVLVMLHPTCAHLYQGGDGVLVSVGHRDAFRRPGGLPSRPRPGLDDEPDDWTDAFLRGVDSLLGKYRAEHPGPLVLGGEPRLIERFRRTSRNLERLAGQVSDADGLTAPDVAQASTRVVEDYLRSRRGEALSRLRDRLARRPDEVASGMAACWRALRESAPSMLLVEQGYVNPGRLEDFWLRRSPTGDHPSQAPVHDLVDDLMEVTIARGGHLALVEDGDLAEHGRIALISRPRDRDR